MGYSLDRRDRKLAGVASTLGDVFNVDPTFVRVAFAAVFFLISWKLAVISYVAAGVYLSVKKNRINHRGDDRSGRRDPLSFGSFGSAQRRTSIKEMRDTLDVNDRRMMAIDHHLSRQNDDLAREIEALRGAE